MLRQLLMSVEYTLLRAHEPVPRYWSYFPSALAFVFPPLTLQSREHLIV